MENFNLIASTGRDFEQQAKAELWFNLISLGDDSPIIFKSEISGLILAYTSLPPKKVIHFLQDVMMSKDPHYTQFIHKLYPLDKVVPSEIGAIKQASLELINSHPYCQPDTEFRITIRKRRTELETQDIISAVADGIKYKVNLQNYDWNLQIEIIGGYTGIGIIKETDVFRPIRRRKRLKN